jgi:mannose-6-phosphate isomerase-like protein (cupin superfamily)
MQKILYSALIALFLITNLRGQNMEYVFTSEELTENSVSQNTRYYEFIKNDALSSGIYTLKKDAIDEQQPHLLDEVYYVLEGVSKFRLAEDEYDVKQGDVIYVPAHVEHKFFNIREDLRLLVFFSEVQPKSDH